jgi:hypothetical protein
MSRSNRNLARKKWEMDRRSFLRCGLGGATVMLGLPVLECMLPSIARAAIGDHPRRFVALFHPHGYAHGLTAPGGRTVQFWPNTGGRGTSFSLTGTSMDELAANKDYLTVIRGSHWMRGGHYGNHERMSGMFLTARPGSPWEWNGTDIQSFDSTWEIRLNGTSTSLFDQTYASIDQLIADRIGASSFIRSLHLSPVRNLSIQAANYHSTLSWRNRTTPIPNDVRPSVAFARLTAGITPEAAAVEAERRRRYKTGILSAVLGDIRALRNRLGSSDRLRLEEYLTGVEELERRINALPPVLSGSCPANPATPANPNVSSVGGYDAVASGFEDQAIEAMIDIIVLGFQCDLTRVGTLLFGAGGHDQLYTFPGFNGNNYHSIAHRVSPDGAQIDAERVERIDRFHLRKMNSLMTKLRGVSLPGEPSLNLLDSTLIYFGGEFGPTDGHQFHDFPLILGGRAGGALNPNVFHDLRSDNYGNQTRIANFLLTMARAMGDTRTRFSNSRGYFDLSGTGISFTPVT